MKLSGATKFTMAAVLAVAITTTARRAYPQTNDWVFWRTKDPATGETVPLDALRDRYLKKGKLITLPIKKLPGG